MSIVPQLLSVFGIAFLSFWASIPAGLALGLQPALVGLTAVMSYAAGVGLVAALGQPVRQRLLRRLGGKIASSPNSAIRRAWDRYGLVGLALLAPVTTGAQVGAALGLAFGVPPRRLFVAMSLGATLWALLITTAATLGILGVRSLT
jgi:uncharacterized membrane protein